MKAVEAAYMVVHVTPGLKNSGSNSSMRTVYTQKFSYEVLT